MLQAVRLITFQEATNAVRSQLEGLLGIKGERVREVKLSRELGDGECQLQDDNEVVNAGQSRFNSVLKILRPDEVEHTDGDFVLEREDEFLDFSPYEKYVSGALNNIKYFLNRALGRTTGMFSRVLKVLFGYLGFDVNNIQFFDELKDNLTSPVVIKEIAKLYSSKVNGVEGDVSESFQGNEKQKALSKLSLWVMNLFDKLNPNFVSLFPLSFCFVNVLTPWLARLKGSVGTTFKILRVVNPWIDEFLSSVMGVFKHEILKVKDNLSEAQKVLSGDHSNGEDIFSPSVTGGVSKPREEIYSIELSTLSQEQYALKKTVDEVSRVLERLIGKKNNISSIITYGVLRAYGFKNYQDFASRTIHKADFIEKLHGCLVEVAKKKQAGQKDASLNREVETKFTDFKERQVARVILALIVLSRSLDEKQITDYPRKFGSFYSWQYLFMPLITLLIGRKSLIGKLLNLVADINPIINDFCFDPLATFQEEIMTIKKESMAIGELLPTLPQVSLRQAIDKVIGTGKDVWKIVKDFSAKFRLATD